MKKVISFLLAVVLCFTLAAEAFAASVKPEAVSETVQTGQNIAVALTVDESYSDVLTLETRLYYNSNLFTYVSYIGDNKDVTVNATPKTDTNGTYMQVTIISVTGGAAVKANEKIATLVFAAKDGVTEQTSAEFKSKIQYGKTKDGTEISASDMQTYSVTITPASTEVKGYAVAASAVSSSITVNEKAQVALEISNKDVNTYNAYYMEVSYDTSVLAYESIESTDAKVIDNNTGTLKIAGYGDNKTCGTDNIVLTFTGKAIGKTEVTVTSAKVDVKANAAEKDAPEATITTGAATITVGGYQVTLPDVFNGKGTANPGQDYTFTAKNTSKKYDFAGSTMGGNPVKVIDNNDGTYTVENVTGPLFITATEKVGKVTINLSGDAVDTIVNKSWDPATEVDEGTELSFTAQLESGKELVVTVNGQEVTGSSRPGAMLYTIAADQVTGPALNIVVNYKAADQATIMESGAAWAKVGNLRRIGWTQSGDKVDAGATLEFFFKPESGKAIEDYVIRANSVDCTYTKVGGRYKVTIPAAIITAGATVTINFDYAATPEPTITVDVAKYLNLDGQSIFLITATGEVADGKVLAYDGNPMYWSSKYGESGAYAWLVIADGTKKLDELKTEATAAITAVNGTKVEIVYDGDVNQTKSVDINDAQLVWNMYNAEYKGDTDFQTVNRLKYLSADMNGDRTVSVLDATAIVNNITK